jgi:hypothetical protein
MVDVATLRTLFTADYGSYEKGAKTVEATNKRLDGTTATTTVDADVRDAEQDLDDIQDVLEDLGDTTAKPEVQADTEAAEADLDNVEDALADIDDTVAKPKIDSSGLDDFKGEAVDTAREGAASFTGEFDDVADIIQETLANALVGFGPLGAAAGLALAAGVGIALSQLQKIADEANAAKEAAGELGKEIVDAGGNIADVDVAGRIAEWATAIIDDKQAWEIWQSEAVSNLDKVRDQAEKTGLSVEALLAAQAGTNVRDVNLALDEYRTRLADVDAELAPLIAKSAAYNDFVRGLGPEVEGLTDAELARLNSLADTRIALDEATTATDDNREALQAAQDTSDFLRAATEDLTVAELQHRDVLEDLNATLAEGAGATRDAAHAYIDLEEQVAASLATIKDAESADADRRRTLIDLADQIVATATAVEEAEGSTHAYNDVIRESRADFIEASTAAGIAGQAAEDLADSYGLIPKNVTTTVQADTQPARQAVETLIRDINGRTIGIRVGAGTRAIEARAGGGDVVAGRPYLVGEEGPELLVPDVAGTVIPAAQTAQMLNGNPAVSTLAAQGSGLSRADLDYLANRIGANVVAGIRVGTAGYSAAQDADALYRRN